LIEELIPGFFAACTQNKDEGRLIGINQGGNIRRTVAAGSNSRGRRGSSVQTQEQDYEALIQPIEDQMMRSIWRIVQDADDVEDALQEALTTIWRRFDRIRNHENPQALILRICLNAAYDVLRRKIRRRRWEAMPWQRSRAQVSTPGELLEARERESAIFRAIAHLSRNQALAVTLRLVHGQSYKAIACVLGCKDNTARQHVARGRARLCELLAPMISQLGKEGIG
jgi:RNA polymerase sigma factor (sigma-70 family)